MSTVLFIDGENFRKKLKEALLEKKLIKNDSEEPDWTKFDFKSLFDKVLEGFKVERKIFYFSKIVKHEDTVKKSEQLIQRQRNLKNWVESKEQGFEVVIAGRVQGQYTKKAKNGFSLKAGKGGRVLVFTEKGVDVRIAVDIVSMICDGKLKEVILASSDSDLQPAIQEIDKRKKTCIYLGFENSPNKGLSYTTDKTILIRNSEVVERYNKE